jgi:hypothetical protein
MSKFAPDVPKSLVDAVNSVLGEAKVEPAKPDPEAVARKKKLDALRDKEEADKAEKGEDKPQGVRKVAGTAYGGSKQKDEPELDEELPKGVTPPPKYVPSGRPRPAPSLDRLQALHKQTNKALGIGEELKGGQVKLDKNHNGKLDSDDFKKLRASKKEEVELDLDEAVYSAKAAKAGKDIGKPGKNFAKIAAKAGKEYGSAESGKKVAGAILAKIRAKHESVEIDERTLTSGETEKKEKYVKSMKKGLAGFKARYGSRAKDVMYATATKMAKEEVELNEGRMKDIYTTMMMHADKQGYSSPKEFKKADYEKVGKEHGISGGDVAVIAGHHTAHSYSKLNEAIVDNEAIAKHLVKKHGKDVTMDHIEDAIDGMDDAHKVDKQEVLHHIKKLTKDVSEASEPKKSEYKSKDLPFTPDKPHGPIAKPGKHGYGPSAAAHLAHQGLKSLQNKSLQKNSFDPDLSEGTGGPIYTKPLVKLGDLLARAKDMKNIKKATIVTPKDENEVVMKKEEIEQVDETMMGKAGCTSEDDKKKAERVITPGTGTSPDPLKARTGLNAVLRKPRAGQTNLKNIPAGNLPGSRLKYSDDDKSRQRTLLKTAIKSTLANKEHGAKRKLPEEVESINETSYELKDKVKHSDGGHIHLVKQAHTGPDPKDQKWFVNHHTFKVDTQNPRRGGDFHDKELYAASGENAEKEAKAKFDELKAKYGVKSEGFNTFKGVSAEIKAGTYKPSKPDPELAAQKKKDLEDLFNRKTKQPEWSKKTEEVEQVDESTEISSREYAQREKAAKNNKKFVAAVKRQKNPGSNTDIAKGIQNRFYKTGKWAEEVSIDETAVLDKYIRSMGYDPEHLDKNKKVMFAKTNAFKTFASSQKTEALYDGGQKGTQDIDDHMSPGATARG